MSWITGNLKGLDTCGIIEPKGSARSPECYRGGYLWLRSKRGQLLAVETHCKSWMCLGCRSRVLSLIQMRMLYGCLILGNCVFTTLTLQKEYGRNVDAVGVQALWTEFLYQWRRLFPAMTDSLAWFKVPELTEAKVPHLHVLMGPMHDPVRKIQAAARLVWLDVTDGSSYIVDVREIWGPAGLVSYLQKYFVKGMLIRDEMESLGFVRRWSRSRNWPSDRLTLSGIDENTVVVSGWTPQSTTDADEAVRRSDGHALLSRNGTDLALALGQDRDAKRQIADIRRLTSVGTSISLTR